MAKSSVKMGIPAILLFIIGIFLIISGIKGIIDYNSTPNELKRALVSLFGGGKRDAITLIIAILDIIAGALLVLSLFLTQQIPLLGAAIPVVVIYLIAKTLYNLFINGITYGKQISFQPDFISWLLLFITNVIIILAVMATKDTSA
ncbi:MAG: hypothetical protein JXB88_09745 [Spirochaetales bacterium]|nr:hypothetical protein [Spirochaetales bacterium]